MGGVMTRTATSNASMSHSCRRVGPLQKVSVSPEGLEVAPAVRHLSTKTGPIKVDSLRANFVPDARGLYTGARCELPGGEVIEVKDRRTPLYDLARELEVRGYGAAHLQSFTPTGTPSLRGLVKVMAGLTVEEGPHGLRCRNYRPARGGESAVDSHVELEGPRGGGHQRLIALLGRTAPPARRRDFYAASLLLKS